MSSGSAPLPPPSDDNVTELVGHPRGTLAIVLVFAALFALGWFAMFFYQFMERGAPHQH